MFFLQHLLLVVKETHKNTQVDKSFGLTKRS